MWRGKLVLVMVLATALVCFSCGKRANDPASQGVDAKVAMLGTIEVTARLVEIPAGAIFKRDLYNYATILKYQVLTVHRGQVMANVIYVGHYNPWKPRREAADERVKNTGGNLVRFQPGQVHRLALQVPIDDHFMGGIVNKYFGQDTGPLYSAAWTNLASE